MDKNMDLSQWFLLWKGKPVGIVIERMDTKECTLFVVSLPTQVFKNKAALYQSPFCKRVDEIVGTEV